MALSMPTMAIMAAPTKEPIRLRFNSHPINAAASAVRFGLRCQRVLGRTLWPFFVQACYLASILLHAAKLTITRLSVVTFHILCGLTQLGKSMAWMAWDSKSIRRLRKKLEFEFFTLILGGGGNNLCLVIFWPGWFVLAFVGFVVSTWCMR